MVGSLDFSVRFGALFRERPTRHFVVDVVQRVCKKCSIVKCSGDSNAQSDKAKRDIVVMLVEDVPQRKQKQAVMRYRQVNRSGRKNKSIRFTELVHWLRAMGFSERIKGDHHINSRQDVVEILNLQPAGSQAKAYQVKQVRDLILKCDLEEPNA